jgi:hypothetical protein
VDKARANETTDHYLPVDDVELGLSCERVQKKRRESDLAHEAEDHGLVDLEQVHIERDGVELGHRRIGFLLFLSSGLHLIFD